MESNPAKESRRDSDGLVAPEGGNKQPKASKRRKTGVTKSAKKMLCRIPKHGRNGNIPSVMVKASHVKSIAMFRTSPLFSSHSRVEYVETQKLSRKL